MAGDDFDDEFTPPPAEGFTPELTAEEANRKMVEHELERQALRYANLRAKHAQVVEENRKLRATLRRLCGRVAELEKKRDG